MKSHEIRRRFLDYFVEHGHVELSGLPLVPNDPSITTLFTIAGMQQMIPYFLGTQEPPAPNMTTVQKTIRTNDIDAVGDFSHCTFFEMLGNFSVGAYPGSYFKEGAIRYTWDFLVNVLGLPADRWWAVTYPGDEEARQAWIAVGMPVERIGETVFNWWGPPGGIFGPCGPNSEIHFDTGVEHSCGRADCRPETECCDRFVEIWNDVFMSYYQEESGEKRELPYKNVDTGMGFERLTMVVQGGNSIYDTDLYQGVISAVPVAEDIRYGHDSRTDRSLRIISDHARAITFLISNGVMPASDGRGYVLRRILRRAALHGRLLGIERPFLTVPVDAVVEIMNVFYSELQGWRDHIVEVVQQEERRFLQTLGRGLGIFEELTARAAEGPRILSGDDAFALYDTHGFPFEMTMELAEERGLAVDREGFELALRRQQERARKTAFKGTIGASPDTFVELTQSVPPTKFTGYDELSTTTEVVGILAEGQPVARADEGDEVELVLASTPFYAEAGGQVGDTGTIRADTATIHVTDTQRPYAAYVVHRARVTEGSISVGDAVVAEVDAERRLHVLPHHSGTHLLHKALQEVLGPEATQAGSLVAPDHLRFDFTWPRGLTDDELRDVQDRVNAAIWANLPVRIDVMAYEDAVRAGAMALFGEKYDDRVRVVSIGDWSKELCGGTHVHATGDIGLLVVTSETGPGAGSRRIQALAGAAAYAFVNDLRDGLNRTAEVLQTRPDMIVRRAEQVMNEVRGQEKRIQKLTRQLAERQANDLVKAMQKNGVVDIVAAKIPADSMDYVEAVSDAIKSRLGSVVVVLGALIDGSPRYSAAVTTDLTSKGIDARAILREAHGKGGGKGPESAKSGGGDASELDLVLRKATDFIKRQSEG